MERLTIRNSDGSVSQPTSTTIQAVFEKLAAYEDTGLEPGEIKSLVAEFRVNLSALDLYRKAKAIKTNADKIRQMSDEELAHFVKRFSDCAFCPAFSTKCKSINFDNCEDAWLDWLKQEVESDA